MSALVSTKPPESGFLAATQRGRRRASSELRQLVGADLDRIERAGRPPADEPGPGQDVRQAPRGDGRGDAVRLGHGGLGHPERALPAHAMRLARPPAAAPLV